MGLLTLIVGGMYASHLTTRLQNTIDPPRSKTVERVNDTLMRQGTQLSAYGEDVVTGVYVTVVILVFAVTSLPFILLGVASAGLAIPLIIVGLCSVAVAADLLGMAAVWRVVNKDLR